MTNEQSSAKNNKFRDSKLPKLHFKVTRWTRVGNPCPECNDLRAHTLDPCFGWNMICLNPECPIDK